MAAARDRWLVFVHQLPAHPSNARVRVWRRLRQIGAVAVKNAVHVLPNTAQAEEDFEWLRTEVLAVGGQATIFTASSLSGVEEKRIIRQFNKMRAEEYGRLRKDIKVPPLDAKARRTSRRLDRAEYEQRTWVTRPRPGVDRFASAWLIRRFVDPRAAFVFAESPGRYPDAVSFDMYQAGGFKHEGARCTFEVLQEAFGIRDIAVRRVSEIVHDLDLKDDRYTHPHRGAIGALVEGLRASIEEDEKLLEHGIALFEALYQSFQRPARKAGDTRTRRGSAG